MPARILRGCGAGLVARLSYLEQRQLQEERARNGEEERSTHRGSFPGAVARRVAAPELQAWTTPSRERHANEQFVKSQKVAK
jgi:hypothetical protein